MTYIGKFRIKNMTKSMVLSVVKVFDTISIDYKIIGFQILDIKLFQENYYEYCSL